LLVLRRRRFKAIEILRRARAPMAEMMDWKKAASLKILKSGTEMVSVWWPRPWND
jgi:hypothetical protein